MLEHEAIEELEELVHPTVLLGKDGHEIAGREALDLGVTTAYVDKMTVGVADGLAAWMDEWADDLEQDLADGPSYIHLGGELGSQGLALKFMVAADRANLAKLIRPHDVGFEGGQAADLAGMGMLYLTTRDQAEDLEDRGHLQTEEN